jgi:hypothetical protein
MLLLLLLLVFEAGPLPATTPETESPWVGVAGVEATIVSIRDCEGTEE